MAEFKSLNGYGVKDETARNMCRELGLDLAEHTHTKDDITDFAHTHTRTDISDFNHFHLAEDIIGTLPIEKGGHGATNKENALINLGVDFVYRGTLTANDDLDTLYTNGIYTVDDNNLPANYPFDKAGIVMVLGEPEGVARRKLQQVISYTSLETAFRSGLSTGWGAWNSTSMSENGVTPLTKGGTGANTKETAITNLGLSGTVVFEKVWTYEGSTSSSAKFLPQSILTDGQLANSLGGWVMFRGFGGHTYTVNSPFLIQSGKNYRVHYQATNSDLYYRSVEFTSAGVNFMDGYKNGVVDQNAMIPREVWSVRRVI